MKLARLAPRRLCGAVLVAAAGVGLMPASLAAQGDLLIAPTRLVLDGRRGGQHGAAQTGRREASQLHRFDPTG